MSRLVLAADVGGTKCLLQLTRIELGRAHPLTEPTRFTSADYSCLEDILETFLQTNPLDAHERSTLTACLAVAGPVMEGGARARVTNLPWALDADAVSTRFSFKKTIIINDFEAMGYGVDCLDPGDSVTLQIGQAQADGPRLVVGAGTGLGVGQLFYQNGAHRPAATEAGHMDFAPVDDEQIALLNFLRRRWQHVSVERLLSGQGLCNIHDFLVDASPGKLNPALANAMAEGDPAAAISRYANLGDAPTAHAAMRLFTSIYGAVTGNLALMTLPRGGVFVTGGIAAKNLDYLQQDDRFLNAFLDKGRMTDLLASFPITVSMDQELGLKGAAHAAALNP
ncbi:MAG: glucokinase [Gammaproteobacteria bacterium]|nr:glucokinase [Gammaproteobacteria bacterium]